MTNLTKLSVRMYVDLSQVSYIDLERKQDTVGPSYMKAKVVISGHQVILNENEATVLLAALNNLGRISE